MRVEGRWGRRTATKRRVFLGALVAVAHTTPAFAQRAWKTPGENDATAARRLSAAGRCESALEPFDDAIEARSGDASLRRDRGLCHERLGHPAPAIDDYRAYLAMEPQAPDAGAIRARLDALEAHESASAPTRAAAPPTAGAATDPDRSTAPDKPKRPDELPNAGDFLVAFHLGERGWSEKGYAVPTVAYGLAVAFAYAPVLEVDGRITLLRTNVLHNSGFGAIVDNTFKLTLDSAHRWEVGLAVGAGFERQTNDFGIHRSYFYGHVNPKVRFLVSGPIALEGAPEIGLGFMDQEVMPTDQGQTAFTFFYGGYLRLCWIIGG